MNWENNSIHWRKKHRSFNMCEIEFQCTRGGTSEQHATPAPLKNKLQWWWPQWWGKWWMDRWTNGLMEATFYDVQVASDIRSMSQNTLTEKCNFSTDIYPYLHSEQYFSALQSLNKNQKRQGTLYCLFSFVLPVYKQCRNWGIASRAWSTSLNKIAPEPGCICSAKPG